MSGRFDGKVAFVTGATSGIGRATALSFGREAANVLVADIATDGNQKEARTIEQAGGQSLAVACDVTRADDIKAALDAAVERFGRLDTPSTTRASSSRSSRPPRSATTSGTASWRSTSGALS
jgi:NAD(P)-dependent dehydrogenase (short-subunit alcohol dehydrogenase family)